MTPTHAASSWLMQHGYLALALGALLEGETVLLLAGAAAAGGLLRWPLVVAVGALAGCAGDTLLFLLGRRLGPHVFARWPRLAGRARPRLEHWLSRHAGLTVVGVRFAYGLRIAGPLVLGTTSLRWGRFLAFNALGALLWAGAFAALGALLGSAGRQVLHLLGRAGVELLAGVAIVLALAVVGLAARQRSAS